MAFKNPPISGPISKFSLIIQLSSLGREACVQLRGLFLSTPSTCLGHGEEGEHWDSYAQLLKPPPPVPQVSRS